MDVTEIMSTPVVTCRTKDHLSEAARHMWEHDCGALPVVDYAGRLVAMLTDRDICMAAYTQGKALSLIPVSSAMSTEVFACRPGDTVDGAEKLMRTQQVHRVPVVDADNRPIGLLSLSDLAQRAATSRWSSAAHRRLTETLAGICRPRRAPKQMHAKDPSEQVAAV